MKDILLYMVQNIALEPDKVTIEEKIVDSQVDFYISCAQEDIGRIIGKKGKIIKALRRILGIVAVKEGKRVNITMVDTSEGKPDSQESEKKPLRPSRRGKSLEASSREEPQSKDDD